MLSPTRSARSSRASTPTSDDGDAVPKTVSPRSRIQAMLAAIDEDSDDEVTIDPTTTNTVNTSHSKPTISAKAAGKRPQKDVTDSEEDDDDEPAGRPRGRLAARMAAAAAPSAAPFQEDGDSSEEEEERSNIYQQIRRELLAEKTKTSSSTEQHREMQPQLEAAAIAPPQEDTPSPPRRRLASKAQRSIMSPTSARSGSPGLFMSPGPSGHPRPLTAAADDGDSGSELPDSEGMRSRLRELVERRRREREQREAETEDPQEHGDEASERPQNTLLSDLFNDDEDVDRAAERKLTQQSRPTRKASKKALEEMNRETQRMSRNMQLTHLAKTKKKFSTADFLSRFSAKAKAQTPLAQVSNMADSSSVAAPESDAEGPAPQDTPPSSPPSVHDEHEKTGLDAGPSRTTENHTDPNHSDDELPDLDGLRSSQYQEKMQARPQKRQAPSLPQSPKRTEQGRVSKKLSPRQYRIVPPPRPTQGSAAAATGDDSDSDLEIVQGDRVASIFSSVEPSRATESRPLHVLRHLAHLHHTEKPRLKKGERPSMTPAQLEIELRRRAKIQAITEREEKLANLKARGIIIMTEEEREREQVVIENMLEKAREEADEIRKKEKKAAKESGEGGVSSDEDEDEDYAESTGEGGAEDAADEEGIELSGSEEDEDENEGNEADDETNDLVDDKAGEDAEDEATADHEQEADNGQDAMDPDLADEPEPSQLPTVRRAVRRNRVVVDEDDDEGDSVFTHQTEKPASTSGSGTVNDDLAAAFGFGAAPAMNVSQMFAGTMADTQDSMDSNIPGDTVPDAEHDSFTLLRDIPFAPIPTFAPTADTQDSQEISFVVDSQNLKEESQGVNLQLETQPARQETPSLQRMTSGSQFGDMDFTPSQDIGLRDDQTPLKRPNIAPAPTQETVLMDVPESPIQQAHRKGRLVRRVVPILSDDDEDAPHDSAPTNNAFETMRKAARAKKSAAFDFDKKTSNARNMVDEQASESEDEYHGLGGVSDDEALADADVPDEADRAMIDESHIDVNERELAALYAEKARQQDEVQTSKLYKDLMSGAMRRKRGGAGGAFDLDSEEDEQVAERRRRRQREEARKRRLLLQDESVGKLGANEKKEAFLRAIEDRDSDDEMDVLDGVDTNADVETDPQSQSQQEGEGARQVLTETSANLLKRKESPPGSQDQQPRKRPSLGRKINPLEAFRAPKSIQDVRESLSFLIDDAHSTIDPDANGTIFSDHEDDDESPRAFVRAPATERRTLTRAGVVDRLTLKKQSSSSSVTATERGGGPGNGAAAFVAPALRSVGSFSKAPSLLRRATTVASDSTTMPPPPPPRREDSGAGVRMGGSKKSSINYQAREAERRVVLERAERKRKENVKKTAGLRRKGIAGGLGGLNAGSGFE